MGQTTFSGPVTTGTVKDTTGTAVGSIRNVGNVVLSQTTAIPAAAGATTVAVLPAGSQIVDVYINTTTVFNSATTLVLGDGTTANKFLTSTTITTVGYLEASDGNLVSTAINNIGTSDVKIVATTSGSAVTGAATITVIYIQKASDGSEGPTP